jgi:hypothetical protein
MAIITDITTEAGYTYAQQYCRPDAVRAGKGSMRIEMGVYESAAHAEPGKPPHRMEVFDGPFDMYAPENLWQQAYAIIKLRWPESTDV